MCVFFFLPEFKINTNCKMDGVRKHMNNNLVIYEHKV